MDNTHDLRLRCQQTGEGISFEIPLDNNPIFL